jgi:hypothetical protein
MSIAWTGGPGPLPPLILVRQIHRLQAPSFGALRWRERVGIDPLATLVPAARAEPRW